MLHYVLLIGVIVAVLAWRAAARRRAKLQALADAQGWTYAPQAPRHADAYAPFALFSQGWGRRTAHLLTGSFGGQPLEVFDYRYAIGTGTSRRVYHQTVVHFALPALRLPALSVRPKGLTHKVFSVFIQDFAFEEYPGFSKHFLLQGSDEAAIRALFVGTLHSTFEGLHGIAVDGGDGHLFVFRPDRRVSPEELPALLTQASTMLRAFLDAVEAAAARSPFA